jgi:hypothetical protein
MVSGVELAAFRAGADAESLAFLEEFTEADFAFWIWSHRDDGDSGEAERSFRREAERHSGINPNTIGA